MEHAPGDRIEGAAAMEALALNEHEANMTLLRRVVDAQLPIVIVLGLCEGLAALVTGRTVLGLHSTIILAYGFALLWVRLQVRRGRPVRAVLASSLGMVLVGVSCIPIYPLAPLAVMLVILLAVVIALPVIGPAMFTRLTVVIWCFAAVVMVGGTLIHQDLIASFTRVPLWFTMSIALLLTTAIMWLLWSFHARMNRLLDRVREAESRLEVKVEQRTLELREREARYRAVSEMTSDYIYRVRVNPDGSQLLEWITETFQRVVGYHINEGADFQNWLDLIHPSDRQGVRDCLDQVISGASSGGIEFRLFARNGQTLWFHTNVQAERDPARPELLFLLGAARNITNQKMVDAALLRVAEQRKRMLEVAHSMLATLTLNDVFVNLQQALREIVTYHSITVYWADESAGLLRPVFSVTADWMRIDLGNWAIPIERGIAGLALRSPHGELVNDAQRDPRSFYPPGISIGKEHLIAVPLHAGERAMGVFMISRLSDPPFTAEEFELLQLLLSYAGLAIANARLFEQISISEARYRTLFEESKDAVFISTPEGRLLDINPAGVALFGYPSRAALLAIDITRDLYVTPEERHHLQRLLEQDGYVQDLVQRLRRLDGAIIDVQETSSAVIGDDGAVVAYRGIVRDITERTHAEAALRESEDRYRRLVEFSPDMIAICQHETFVYINTVGRRMLGLQPADQLPTPEVWSYLAPADRTRVRNRVLANERSGEQSPRFEEHLTLLDGSTVDVEVISIAIQHQGAPATLVVLRDISERKRAESARLALERRLLETQKLESLGVLAGGVAHDFNNLLMVILGNTALARLDIPADSPAHESLIPIETATRRAAELAQQMLAYSGKGRLVVRQVDVNAVIEDLAGLIRASIPKLVALRVCPSQQPITVVGDIAQIRQVVMNLVMNAAEATGEDEGLITISTGVLFCSQADLAGTYLSPDLPAGNYMALDVTDSGCGMDAATQARIFDPFFTTKFVGRGLGLAAVLGIVRAHEGAISVTSALGQGTTMRVLIPLAATPVEPPPPPAEPPSQPDGGVVLVIDDEADVRAIARRMLERRGYQVLVAEDGLDGIEICRANADTIACAVVDLTMPHMGGEETCQTIQTINPSIPVVLMSGYSVESMTGRFTGLELAGFLQKPFTSDDLYLAVQRAVAARTGLGLEA